LPIKRAIFNEITKDAVLDALNNPLELNYNIVHSQETRRMIDRIVGFRLSKITKKAVASESAGRVQSVALRLVVEREQERDAFIALNYFKLKAKFGDFTFDYEKNDKQLNNETVNNLFTKLKTKKLTVTDIKEKTKKVQPYLPYSTATLQRDASVKLIFSVKKTMATAQKLYEGKKLANGHSGLITYMRTDSHRLSKSFIDATNSQIKKEFGEDFIGTYRAASNSTSSQDGHEAIRPTVITNTPTVVAAFLTKDELKLYTLIYNRALCSLMAPSLINTKNTTLSQNGVNFKYETVITKFVGHEVINKVTYNVKPLNLAIDDIITVTEFYAEEHETTPPPRFNEATLIKQLVSLGVGRPSTYASIIETLKKRSYVTYEEKYFIPTTKGCENLQILLKYFPNLINVEYTNQLEAKLNNIALGNTAKLLIMEDFYDVMTDQYNLV